MFSEVSIDGLRGIGNLKLPALGRVTLLTGRNGSGKTTVLEGLFLLAGAGNTGLGLTVNAFRGLDAGAIDSAKGGEELWASLFPFYDTTRPISIRGIWNGRTSAVQLRAMQAVTEVPLGAQAANGNTGLPSNAPPRALQMLVADERAQQQTYTLRIAPPTATVEPAPPPPLFPALYQPSRLSGLSNLDVQRFGELQKRKEQSVVVDALRIVEPRIQELQTIVTGNVGVVYADIGRDHLIQLHVMGDGPVRVFWLSTNLASVPRGLLLVDEFENGIHYSALPAVWKAVDSISRRLGVQVVATTHSRECVEAAYEVFAGNLIQEPNDFRLIRLARTSDDSTKAFVYDREAIEGAIKSGLEVR